MEAALTTGNCGGREAAEEEGCLDSDDNWVSGIEVDRRKEAVRATIGIQHVSGQEGPILA